LWEPFFWNAEQDNRFHGVAAEFYKAGVKNLSINTDSVGFGEQEELAFNASMSARMGLDDQVALKAITINPARALGIADRVGSLEVGKDADIVIKKGSLLDPTTPVDLVLINGKIVYRCKGADLVIKQPAERSREKE
jgi:imidazolonepropionase-like amidohydrolase